MDAMNAISDIARTIQLSVAPVFFLAAIGSILNVLTGRINRVVDRSRVLEQMHATTLAADRGRLISELRLLDRRISLITTSILLCVTSAVAICLVIMSLFVSVLAQFNFSRLVALAFIFALVTLVTGLVLFLVEIRIAIVALRIRKELLE